MAPDPVAQSYLAATAELAYWNRKAIGGFRPEDVGGVARRVVDAALAVQWEGFSACPICGVGTGEPCVSIREGGQRPLPHFYRSEPS